MASQSNESIRVGDGVVYPCHGAGRVREIGTETIAGERIELTTIVFDHTALVVRVPTAKLASAGVRRIAGADALEASLSTAASRGKVSAQPWHRRAALIEDTLAKGTLAGIAGVIRDLRLESSPMVNGRSRLDLLDRAKGLLAAELAAARRTSASVERVALDRGLAGTA